MSKLKFSTVDLFLAMTFAAACVFWGETSSMKSGTGVYPRLVSGMLAVLAVCSFIQERLGEREAGDSFSLKSICLIIGISVYILLIASAGYFVSTYVYLLVMFQYNRWGKEDEILETKPLIVDSITSFCITGMIALVFKVALKLQFPEAWLF